MTDKKLRRLERKLREAADDLGMGKEEYATKYLVDIGQAREVQMYRARVTLETVADEIAEYLEDKEDEGM